MEDLDSLALSTEEYVVLRRLAALHRRYGKSLKIVLYENHSGIYEQLVERGVLAKRLAARLAPRSGFAAWTFWLPPDSPFYNWCASGYIQ